MVGIADMLESDHGWSIEQSEAWLHRMVLWEEFYCKVRPSKGYQPRQPVAPLISPGLRPGAFEDAARPLTPARQESDPPPVALE